MINRYLVLLYLKYVFIILIALILFFIGVDLMQNFKKLPNSANLQVIYIFYNIFYSLHFVLPLSLVFGLITTKIALIRSNTLVAFYSLGYSKNQIIKPFFFTSLLMTLVYISLNTTEMAYSKDKINKILHNSYFSNSKENLLLKYYNNYIYFNKLYPLLKKAEGVKIFTIENDNLSTLIKADEAYFVNNHWTIKNATIITKSDLIDIKTSKLFISKNNTIDILEGFKPKIIDNVYEVKAKFSIIDAIDTIKLLSKQNINTSKVKSILYSMTIFPLFAPLFVIIIFYFVPISNRSFNIALFSSVTIFITLSVWGLLFALIKLSISGVTLPELSIILPIIIIKIFAFYLYRKNT